MIKLNLILLLLITSISVYSQELCSNGIDDDADGLVDLQDSDCNCGVGLNPQFNNAIPNPDFNNSSCCPTDWYTDLNCLDNWTSELNWEVHYTNECNGCNINTNFLIPPNCGQPGNGFLGLGFRNWSNGFYSYDYNANTCLNTPLYPGNFYVLDFQAFNSWRQTWTTQNGPINISILGSTSCTNIPSNMQSSCSDPDWDVLDSIVFTVPIDTSWHNYSFTFSPSDTIYAIALGQTCSSIGNGSLTDNSWQRLLIDNLTLFSSKKYNLQISETGSICDFPYVLSATIDTTGGTWQWYKDSVAILGQTSPVLDITGLGTGNFTAVYSLNGQCQGLNLEVLPPVYPSVFISANNINACPDDSINFDGFSFISSGTVDHYYYDFGNGDSAFIEDPSYAFDTPGNYTVEITAESDLGCTANETQDITINPKPIPDFTANNACLFDTVNFASNTTLAFGLIDSLAWNFGDNSIGNDSLELHDYSIYGDYTVQLFVQSSAGCADSISKIVSIHPLPVANYTAANDCENVNIAFLNSSTLATGSITAYNWSFGDNTFANTINTNHTYTNSGNYTSSLIVISDSGCVDTTNLILEIYPEPLAIFHASSSCYLATFLDSSTITVGSSIDSRLWDFGNTITSNEPNPTHYYSANANYNVTLQVVSNYGCTDDTIVPITILNNFFADMSPKENQICAGECLKLVNNSTPTPNQVMNYYWKISDGQTSKDRNPTFCFNTQLAEPANYDVFFKISTSSGCIDSIVVEDAISVIPVPIADFSFTPENPTLSNLEVLFKNLSSLAENFEWNFGDNTYSTEVNPVHKYPELGQSYTVSLIAMDADNTCENEYSQTLVVLDEVLFFIPNTFTPNGSGINDLFKPVFVSGINVYEFKFQIFNRFGELVFESFDPEGYWNGEYGGQTAQEGVYVWKLDFIENTVDKTQTHTGTVNVLR